MCLYKVVYTEEGMIDNQIGTMEIEAKSLEAVYELVNIEFPELIIDNVLELVFA